MHERRYGAGMLVKADGEGREDGGAVPVGMAVERFVDMFEAALHGDAVPRKKRKLRRVARQAFERGKAVERGKLADRIHLCVHVEWRKTRPGLADLGDAQPDFIPHLGEWIGGHMRPS